MTFMEGWVFFALLLARALANPAQQKRQRVREVCPSSQGAAQGQAYPITVGGLSPTGPSLLFILFILAISVVGLLACLMLWEPSFRRQGDGEREGAEEALLTSIIEQLSAIQLQVMEVQRISQRERT